MDEDEYEKQLSAIAAVLRNEVDRTRQMISDLREMRINYADYARQVDSLKVKAEPGLSVDELAVDRLIPPYDTNVPYSLDEMRMRWCHALTKCNEMSIRIPIVMRKLTDVKTSFQKGLAKATKFERDVKWLQTPFWPKYFMIMKGNSVVSQGTRRLLITVTALVVVVGLALLFGLVVLSYFYLWPLLLVFARAVARVWHWMTPILSVVFQFVNAMT